MTSRPSPGPRVTLPARAVVVATTPVDGARFAAAFDETTVIGADELAAALAGSARPADTCVLLTGVPVDGLAPLLALLRDDSRRQVLIELGGPAGADLRADAGRSLRGFDVLDVVPVAGSAFLRLRPAPDATAVPDLAAVDLAVPDLAAADAVPDAVPAAVPAAGSAAGSAAVVPAAGTADPAPATPSAGPRLPSARKLGVAVAGAVLVAAIGTAVALATDTGYDGGALTVLLVLAVANLAYVQRTNGARSRAERRAARTADVAAKERRSSDAEALERHLELTHRIAELETAHDALAVDVELVLTAVLHRADVAARQVGTGDGPDRD